MKKKLLTVLLAVVMVFGVFGLTACGGSNADEDYNYYGIKYEIEDEVKIQALTFQGIYKMFTTAGNFVVYVATEGANGAKAADFQAVNKLANDWGITIYHFNPELSGGYAANNTNAVSTNIIKELDATGAASQLKTVQDTLTAISKVEATTWSDNSIIAITGAESAVSGGKISYKGKISATNTVADGAKSIAAIATKNPSYGAYTEAARDIPYIPEAYNTTNINTMNLFGDARLHMYNDDNGVDALLDEKEDVFVTVANYAMFAHLMDYNEGYFPVFFGGTWCGNTQAIVKATNQIAKDYGCTKIYFFDPRLEDGTKIDAVSSSTTWSMEQYEIDNFNAMETLAFANEALAKAVAANKTAAEVAVEAAEAAVEAAEEALEAAKEADPVDETAVEAAEEDLEAAEEALSDAEEVLADAKADLKLFTDVEDAEKGVYNAQYHGGYTTSYSVVENSAYLASSLNTRTADGKGTSYNFNFLYGKFLKDYLNTYKSEWNIQNADGTERFIEITVDGAKTNFTRMCVPNIMMFNGEEEGKAELVALAEAEYTYANVNVEGNAQQIAWTEAVKKVFDANPYLTYVPVVVAEEAPAADAGASAGGSSAPAAGGGDAC